MQKRHGSFYIFVVFGIIGIFFILLFSVGRFSLPGWLDGIVVQIQKGSLPIKSLIVPSVSREQEKNQDITKKIKDQNALERENKALRDQFQTTRPNPQSLMPAKIIGAPGFIPGVSLPEFLVLDKGSDDTVAPSQAVVYKDNLIGVIERTSKHLSKVILVSSKKFSATARVLKNESQYISGVVKGQGGEHIVLDNVLLSEKIEVGSIVVTGTDKEESRGIPPDLIIGKIYSIEKNPSALFQTASVQSLIDPIQLSTVFVLIGE